MILPSKHSRLDDSMLHGGSAILRALGQPTTVTVLWERARGQFGSFHAFCLAMDFLHCVGLVAFVGDGDMVRRTSTRLAP